MTEFETIYRRYFTDVELYLRAITKDESLAEELTEQVFFQALKALPKFRGDCDIRTWLCSMARNAFLSHLRKTKPTEDISENTALCYIVEDIWTGPVLCSWQHFVEGMKGRDSLQTFSCVSTRRSPCRVRSVVTRKEKGRER